MKNFAVKIFLVIIVFSHAICSQEKTDNFILNDAAEDPNCELLLHHLNYLFIETEKYPDAAGYVIIYGGTDQVKNNLYELFIKSDSYFKVPDNNRFKVITAKGGEQARFEFWISKNGVRPVVPEEPFTYILPKTNEKFFFGKDRFEIAEIDGRSVVLPASCSACCLLQISFHSLKLYLQANPDIKAYFEIRSKTERGFGEISDLFREEARDSEIDLSRLKFSYAGKIGEGHENWFEAEVWLVRDKK